MKNIFASVTKIQSQPEIIDWQVAYEQNLPKIFHFFCYKVGDPVLAEDLTAIAFEKAWCNRKNFHAEKGELSAWLMGIARNVAVDHFRKKRREIPLEESQIQPSAADFYNSLQQKVDFQTIFSILVTYPSRERELIALKYGAEMSHREISRVTGLSESNVGTILARVLKKLKKEWEQNHE